MSTFEISYIVLWLVLFITVYGVITVLNEAIKIRSTLYEKHEGLPQGVLFPLEGRSPVNGEPLNLLDGGKVATLVFLTSSSCLACKKLYPTINDFQKKKALYQYLVMMSGTEEEVSMTIKEYDLHVPVIRVDNFKELKTPLVPFGYYVSNEGLIQAKGIVNNEFHIKTLISSGDRKLYAS